MEYKKNPNVDVKKIGQEFKLLGLVFALALSFVLISSTTAKVEKKMKSVFLLSDDTEVIDNTEQKKEPPKVIPQTIQIVQNTVETPTTIDNTELDEEEEIKPPDPPSGGGGEEKEKPDFEQIYEKVEKMPSYRHGEDKLSDFINDNLEYPQAESDNGVSGKVNVYFVVDANGNIENINTDGQQSNPPPSKAFKKAAEDVVRKMAEEKNSWIPGIQGNRNVKVRCIIPIIFEPPSEDY